MLLFLSLSPATRNCGLLPRLAPGEVQPLRGCAPLRRRQGRERGRAAALLAASASWWGSSDGGKGSSKASRGEESPSCGDDRLPDGEGDEHRGSRARRGDGIGRGSAGARRRGNRGADQRFWSARPRPMATLPVREPSARPAAGSTRPDAASPPSACDRDAQGDALRSAIEAGPFLVKPNRKELGRCAAPCGDIRGRRAGGRALRSRGVGYAAVSCGAEGCPRG